MTQAPLSTYRLQMTSEFGFARAAEVVPYLHRLGVTDAYCSPILRAAPGSTHGYDVADPTQLDPRLGTREEFDRFSDALREHGMGLVLDIVPNHMAASTSNPWWRSVLQGGQGSAYAHHFDISWEAGGGRVLLPVLGAPLDEVLANDELSIEGDELVYYGNRWPLADGTAALGSVREVVDAQHYELADWREQATRLNYRRFFDITDLVGVRVEDERVFDDVHRLVLGLVREGRVTAVRVDHVDGLRDPKGYLERLQAALREASGAPGEMFPVYVEKILAPDERLPATWPVSGTTGYEFLDSCDGLFVDADGVEVTAEGYAEVTDATQSFDEVVAQAKLRIVREAFWGELGRLAHLVLGRPQLGDEDDEVRRVRDALAVVTTKLPVYRTYVDEQGRTAEDESVIENALAAAAGSDGVDPIALGQVAAALREDTDFVLRWQQFSGPVTAKSVEDTAFYRYMAVPARNEVGAHPSHPAGSAGSFHWLAADRATHWPACMNASSTHDTKRSEDVRARMLVLTERPERWTHTVEEWLEQLDAPDPNDGWMVANTVVGAWPLSQERLAEYVTKAVREEKLRSSWTDPDEGYEAAILGFAERLRTSGLVEPVVERIRARGDRNSLAMTTLRLFAPGVPDVYQGTEVEFLALVDPDNRRPIDHDALAAQLDTEAAPAKLRLVAGMLRARRDARELFTDGEYVPVRCEVPGTLAYARRLGDRWALVAVPIPGFVAEAAATLELPDGAPSGPWRCVVTGGELDVAGTPLPDLLAEFPVLAAVAG